MDKDSEHHVIIGAGIGGLALAGMLAKSGRRVTIVEKNDHVGGRASLITVQSAKGEFIFDKGPSWYMMPDMFEHCYSLLGERIEDHLTLERLAPSYRVFHQEDATTYDFYSDIEKNAALFESLEPGSGTVLKQFLGEVKEQYEISKNEFLFKNYDSITDFLNKRVAELGARLPLFKKQSTIINALFSHELLRKVLQYQTVLLGTSPFQTPGIYTLMNYVDFVLGVWYPRQGIYEIPKTLAAIAEKHGAIIRTQAPVKRILLEGNRAVGVELEDGTSVLGTHVISNADYHFTDQVLLPPSHRTYSARYWEKRTLAPSAFILFLGVDGKIPSITHHNLLFSKGWKTEFDKIFKTPAWSQNPSLYVCAGSVTDPTVAPKDCENLFVLVPIAAGLSATDAQKEAYADTILATMERDMHIPKLRERLLVKRIYSMENFVSDYNAFKGTALGLAHTLRQTAIFRPNNVSRHVENLYYVGAGTNPGIGMPICLASAELVYKRIAGITTPHPLTAL